MKLSYTGKKIIINKMREKGLEFISASILLKQTYGISFTYIHLLLQGLEIILKYLLLRKDYDRYHKKIKNKFGHKISKLIMEAKKIYKINNIKDTFFKELNNVEKYYLDSNLRYGSLLDIFIDINTINIETIELKIYSLIKIIIQKKL